MTSFRESQNMFALWLLLIILPIFGYQVYQDINNPIGILKNPGIIITGIVLIGLMLLRLKTNYTSEGIYIVFIPFVWKKFIPWDTVSYAYVRTYGISDFGGWGYRFGKDGRAMTAKGNQGLQLVLKDSSKILIGTQKPEEVQKIINQYKPSKDEF